MLMAFFFFTVIPSLGQGRSAPPPNKPATVKWDSKKRHLKLLYDNKVVLDAVVRIIDKSGFPVESSKIEVEATEDISGEKFWYLTAIRPVSGTLRKGILWECVCDCGQYSEVKVYNLVTGNTKSCGCLQRAITITRHMSIGPEDIPIELIRATQTLGKLKKAVKNTVSTQQ